MIQRNKLVQAVIWPAGPNAHYSLIDAEGVELARVAVAAPVKGFDLAKVVPPGLSVDVTDCEVLSMTGKNVARTRAQFDTAVVTERPEITFEERMARLERRDKRREEAEKRRQEEHERVIAQHERERAEILSGVGIPEPDGEETADPEPVVEERGAEE